MHIYIYLLASDFYDRHRPGWIFSCFLHVAGLTTCRPNLPPPPQKSGLIRFLSKKMRNVKKPMKKQLSDFCDTYFLRNNR